MKKYLLILFIFIIQLQAYAFEDYIIVSDKPVESVSSGDKNVLEVFPFFTIGNEKNTILVKIKNAGKTDIFITTREGFDKINVNIDDKKTAFSKNDGFTYLPLDIPSSLPDIRGRQ